jgi:hypothetical protein
MGTPFCRGGGRWDYRQVVYLSNTGNSLTEYSVKSTSNFVFFVIFFLKYRNHRPEKALATKKKQKARNGSDGMGNRVLCVWYRGIASCHFRSTLLFTPKQK